MKKQYKLYYIKDGVKIEGVHPRLFRLSGNVSGLYGDVSELSGNVYKLSGDVSGLSGNVSGLSGNLDACEITNEEREKGVDIKDLII